MTEIIFQTLKRYGLPWNLATLKLRKKNDWLKYFQGKSY